jgi:hypothetical protein
VDEEKTAAIFGAERIQRPAHRFYKRLFGASRDLTRRSQLPLRPLYLTLENRKA